MGKISSLARRALAEPMYAGAPPGHNNRVLVARVVLIGVVTASAAAAALLGVGLSRVRSADETAFVVGAVGFAGGLVVGWSGRRVWGRFLSHNLGVTSPVDKAASG